MSFERADFVVEIFREIVFGTFDAFKNFIINE
jgi:hypothetical protein